MATLAGFIPNCSGIISPNKRAKNDSKVLLQNLDYKKGRFFKYPKHAISLQCAKIFQVKMSVGIKCNSYVRRNHQDLRVDDDFGGQPFWLNLIKQTFWAMKSLLEFLVEQPSQLKYIEWPSFQSTLKTATLTLVLVGLLIVALSSVDSALSYLLALLLRRTA